ncbi:MAG: glutamate-5-semialdehyde dehydrogenase [Proteobacteria bacterium]|nr:glutamate-5-semialdehyde dehydrogenase [Pseudomonadota bacterium]MDA1059367.1 glutamate-5-semialdehyde dehydrogenase [Pseudomonadota bacterium]
MSVAEARDDIHSLMTEIGVAARSAARLLARASTDSKNQALRAAAQLIRDQRDKILAANARDVADADAGGISQVLRDRLALNVARIDAMAEGLELIASLPDPVGEVFWETTRPNGLRITRVRVPLGVIGIIYESRPNVTADAGALCMKSGNAVILRGGSESFHSSQAIVACLHDGLRAAGLPVAAVQLVPTRDRAAVGEMLIMNDSIDIIVPRGGRSLIERVQRESRIPVLAHLDGNCHVYIHEDADPEKALAIVHNAKLRRLSICGAAESLVVDQKVARTILPGIIDDLSRSGCEIRGDAAAQKIDQRVIPATTADWSTEYLDAIISLRIVDGIEDAIAHIEQYGSHHTDSIITENEGAAARFLAEVDSAIVLHNASTQFADGAEFGMGAEIGISTDRLHARGPVGLEQLTTYKYLVYGNGQVRP